MTSSEITGVDKSRAYRTSHQIRRPLAALTATLALVALSCTQAQAVDAPAPKVLIFGDSITSLYNDTPGSATRGWWSYVARDVHMTPVKRGIFGSGMLKRASCKKSTQYIERLPEIAKVKPKVIIVEGGRNDWHRCTKTGKIITATRSETSAAVRRYLHDLALASDASGVSRKRVYVFAAWGTARSTDRKAIQPIVKKWATRYGLVSVSVSYLADMDTRDDKTHPDKSGNIRLYRRVMNSTLSNLM